MADLNDPTLTQNQDFQAVLNTFLAAYRPILEHELRVSESAATLIKESQAHPPTCDDEIAIAVTLFERFFTKDVALRVLPVEGRQILGNPDQWEWCYRRILCCLIFGWLVCRGPRTFRGFAYYLYQYWRCVRQALGEPVSAPPTVEEQRDFSTLVKILATAYAPTIKDQIKDLEYPIDIPKEIIAGAIDCNVDNNAAASLFQRLCSPEASRVLFGKSFEQIGVGPLARNCCCYCVAALEFGCCLGRAKTLVEALRCLEEFFLQLRRCFQPLIAIIDTPPACSSLTFVAACSNLSGIEIDGTAAGAAFTSYTLSYSVGGPIINDAVVYPDCSRPPVNPSSGTPVNNGVLGYLDVDLLPPATTTVTVYLDVYGSGGLHLQVSAVFNLAINAIQITAVATVAATVGQDPFNPSPSIIKMVQNVSNPAFEQSVGGLISVTGSAYAFGCGNQMTQYQLSEFGPAPGAIPLPAPTPSPTALGGNPLIAPVIYDNTPSHPWSSGCPLSPTTPNTILNGDLVASWSTELCLFPSPHTVPKISSINKWSSGTSGRYVIFLEVDEAPITPPHTPVVPAGEDQITVWIDNYPVTGLITQVGNVVGCGDLHLKDYVGTTAPVLGLAWDYPIDITAAQKLPNDNFGSYSLSYQKNGGSMRSFLASDYTPNGAPAGTSPTVRVPNLWQATPPTTAQAALLASWDIVTALDGGPPPDPNNPCVPTNPWQLPRGCRCAYVLELVVGDTTWVGDGGNNNSSGPILFAVNIINDIGT
ncbi:hypothetical protein H7849_02790 [Alloacidobacterium dinghuense]|uniref:Uncharacterized protein n=1 Tax=Alloacidobacterium dinghuense TaxID=2763107 RepID=A0A7G8BK64_9BACT|nr:hypothetical protein [Alloacidobacterium dinghuense]QNI32934.1 hypothetical protein H7849_02790 [Alloacidobacterium dinghuense]